MKDSADSTADTLKRTRAARILAATCALALALSGCGGPMKAMRKAASLEVTYHYTVGATRTERSVEVEDAEKIHRLAELLGDKPDPYHPLSITDYTIDFRNALGWTKAKVAVRGGQWSFTKPKRDQLYVATPEVRDFLRELCK
jgi:hypothetical protein